MDSPQQDAGSAPVDLKKSRRKKPILADPARVDRLPPHSLEAEVGVLGCVLLSPMGCMDVCLKKLKRADDIFYDLRHQCIFDVMVEMHENRESIDLITLHQKLKDRNQIEAVGGFGYLASLQDAVPSAANLDYYLDIVLEKFALRNAIQICQKTVGDIYTSERTAQDVLNEFASGANHVAQACTTTEAKEMSAMDGVKKVIDYAEERMVTKGSPGLGTGLKDWDALTGGLQPGWLYVIAARPGCGKTAIMGNMVQHISIDSDKPLGCLVFSLEMSSERFIMRLCCGVSKVNSNLVRRGIMNQAEFRAFSVATQRVASAPILVVDDGSITPSQIMAISRSHVSSGKVKAIFIDYIQRVRPDQQHEKKTYEIGDISLAFQNMAKELNVPVVVLAQLKREYQQDNNRQKHERLPNMSDLGDSGMIERDADCITLLHRLGGQNLGNEVWQYQAVVDKNRDDGPGLIDLVFFKKWTKFECMDNKTQ